MRYSDKLAVDRNGVSKLKFMQIETHGTGSVRVLYSNNNVE